jgi:hypothetical protein
MPWQDVTRSSLCSGVKSVEQNMHRTSSFPNSFSESEELQSWGCSKIMLSFLMQFDGHFWPNQQQHQCLPQFESILDGHLSRYLLSAPFRLEIKPFAPILVFLSQIHRLWNKVLWQFPVHFRHPWRIKKTDSTRQVITRTLLKINKRNSVCERMLVDST